MRKRTRKKTAARRMTMGAKAVRSERDLRLDK
jgi:hypothetical protein